MIVDQRDFQFLLSWLDLPLLLQRPRFDHCGEDDIVSILETAARISEYELAPHLRAADTTEPHLDANGEVTVLDDVSKAVRTMADAGMFASAFDMEYGGLQLPHIVHTAALGLLMAGNLSTASFQLLTFGNAQALCAHASPAQQAAFAEPQIVGEMMGTMCLSEPHAGSSLGDIRTRALPDGDDELGRRFRIFGNKMWISGGDHNVTENIVHLVLAKVPDEDGNLRPGSKGISLFIVPKILPDGQRNDITVAGLNHKMGYRGIPNCALNFGEGKCKPDDVAGAIGWLVGNIGQGLPQMFHMMNEARISVGLAGAMLACRGYQMSLDYARDRRQGRHLAGGEGPQVPIIEHADVRRMLLTQRAISQGAAALVLYSARLVDEQKSIGNEAQRAEAAKKLALITPVTKTWPSEWAQVSLHHALQIHGGAGYTRDFEVELLYRDNRLNPIHEGTTGIQGIDLVGRKIRRDGGASFAMLAQDIRATIEKAGAHRLLTSSANMLTQALAATESAVTTLLAENDDKRAIAHGTPFLFGFGHLVVGWLWLDQALYAASLSPDQEGSHSTNFLDGRVSACRFFAETELPKVEVWLQAVVAGSDLVLSIPTDQF
ncbi:acyl-CoA dehydrogenase [Altericroceibacterium spongiae]|uniref:Acyl-CoA dehydrogenase n=1 Tax=Altericroceibacterium spongiae TaxID=2320269 RepID=A0A420ER08_9SPHN|nr:acyl-CoA dehydrogenase [Altericroceibacterium spongiae]RKF23080.1 acyl-CoA dehydrogenase [Altericroceibacterium spongiae]